LDHEITMRANARATRRIREAGFGMRVAPEEFELREGRGITRRTFHSLIPLGWLHNRHDRAITGHTGISKNYLSVALGVSAIRGGNLLRYYKLAKLLEKVAITRADGSYPQFAHTLAKTHLP
jgi:DNA replication protein DnaC